MATWRDMANENRKAARLLLSEGYHRSSISRCYYAVYCLVTGELSGRIHFGYGGNNPTHGDLPTLIVHHFTSLSVTRRHQVRKAVARLLKARVTADYAPEVYIDTVIARQALQDMANVFKWLEVSDD